MNTQTSTRPTRSLRPNAHDSAKRDASDLEALLSDVPLLKLDETLESIHPAIFDHDLSERAICFGFGLCTGSVLSKGLPVDALGMLSAALVLAERLGIGHVIFWVADVNARHNSLLEPERIDPLAHRYLNLIRNSLRVLGADRRTRTTTLLGSVFDRDPRHGVCERMFGDEPNRYLRRQMADVEYLRRHHGAVLKLSWSMGGERSSDRVQRDERWFDERYLDSTGEKMSFAFIEPGRTLSRHRPRCAPYISQPDESRVLLESGQDIEAMFARARVEAGKRIRRKCVVHLERTLELWQMAGGPLPDESDTLAERLDAVIVRLAWMPSPSPTPKPGPSSPYEEAPEDDRSPVYGLREMLRDLRCDSSPRMTT